MMAKQNLRAPFRRQVRECELSQTFVCTVVSQYSSELTGLAIPITVTRRLQGGPCQKDEMSVCIKDDAQKSSVLFRY